MSTIPAISQPTVASIPSGRYVLLNHSTVTYLNALNYITTPGTNIVMAVATDGALTNNIWNVMLTDSGAYTFQNVGTVNFAVPAADDTTVVIGTDPTQQWALTPGKVPFSWVIKPANNPKVAMEPLDHNSNNAVPVVLKAADDANAYQNWFICAVKV